MTLEQRSMLLELRGLEEQIQKGHYLNVHFRAFQLADKAWKEHIRQSALGSRYGTTPVGSLLDDPDPIPMPIPGDGT